MSFNYQEFDVVDEKGTLHTRCEQIRIQLDELKAIQSAQGTSWGEFIGLCDMSWLFHENGLEGIIVTMPEIKSVVDEKIISDKSLLPMYEHIKNQHYCLQLMRQLVSDKSKKLTHQIIIEMHKNLVPGEKGGVYRHDIPIHRTYFHKIYEPKKIEEGLISVIDYINTNIDDDSFHPIEFAANVHHRFMNVYPFSKFSGFLGRLIMNYILERSGYLPAIIHQTERQHYYEALKGNEKKYRYFLCDFLEHAIKNAIRFYEKSLAAKGAIKVEGHSAHTLS